MGGFGSYKGGIPSSGQQKPKGDILDNTGKVCSYNLNHNKFTFGNHT